MNKTYQFEVNDKTFDLNNSKKGLEEILFGKEVLSSQKSLFGGKHKFDLEDEQYEVKVKNGFNGLNYQIKINGVKVPSSEIKHDNKVSPTVMCLCYWPLFLMFIGGGIGGLCGGLAAAGNFKIYKSNLSNPLKIVLNILSGLLAFLVWAVAAAYISNEFQD